MLATATGLRPSHSPSLRSATPSVPISSLHSRHRAAPSPPAIAALGDPQRGDKTRSFKRPKHPGITLFVLQEYSRYKYRSLFGHYYSNTPYREQKGTPSKPYAVQSLSLTTLFRSLLRITEFRKILCYTYYRFATHPILNNERPQRPDIQ